MVGWRRVVALGSLLCCALLGCQPVDSEALRGPQPGAQQADAPLGAPDPPLPESLDELLAAAGAAAERWQDRAVVAEITVELAAGEWVTAQVTYLAADSDRFLRYRADRQGSDEARPTLAAVALPPVTESGVEAIPAPPSGTLDPAPLLGAASATLADCGVDPRAVRVTYTSGAPFAWDGARWTQPPVWTVTVSDDRRLTVLDPVTGEGADVCADVR